MKILQLVTKRQYRGAEVFAADLSKELIKLGHEIIFAGLYKNENDILLVEQAVNIDIAESKTGKFSFILANKLVRLIKHSKPDIIQCNGSDTLKYMVAASYFVPQAPILYRNISMISTWIPTEPVRIIYKYFFKRISHVSSVGEEAAADFIKTIEYQSSRVSVIPRGIPIKEIKDPNDFLNIRSSLGIQENEKVAIHIGNFSQEKNHDFLLNLFSEIREENSNIKLICVGTGILFDKIKTKIKEKDLEGTVFLLGFRKDIPELLATSDCFVLPSKVEGVPGVILEAASQKIPSVAINVGGVSEVLIDGSTGYLINNFNIKDFKVKLLDLLLNDDLRKQFGKNAYKLVIENYNPRKNAIRFERLYENLISS